MCVLTNSIFFLFKSKVGHKVVGLKVKTHWMHVYLPIKKREEYASFSLFDTCIFSIFPSMISFSESSSLACCVFVCI